MTCFVWLFFFFLFFFVVFFCCCFFVLFIFLILQVVDNFCMAKTTILLTELMKSHLFNYKGMLALIFCLLLIYTKLLAVA